MKKSAEQLEAFDATQFGDGDEVFLQRWNKDAIRPAQPVIDKRKSEESSKAENALTTPESIPPTQTESVLFRGTLLEDVFRPEEVVEHNRKASLGL